MKSKKTDAKLKLLLIFLIAALVVVVGYIVLREYQYGVSDSYYDSLRNTGCLKDVIQG